MAWDVFIGLLLILVCIVEPWNFAFEGEELLVDREIFGPLVDIIFFIDILVNFNSSYFVILDAECNILITDRKQIAKTYLKGWFWIDLISSVPFELFSAVFASGIFKIARVSKIQKLFKLLKIPRILKLFSLKSRLAKSYFSMYSSSITTDSMIIVLILLGIFCHLAACSWVIITHVNMSYEDPSWIDVEELH